MSATTANQTMTRFGHPETLAAEYPSWVVLARPQQVTLGALVLARTEPATAFSKISPQAFAELGRVIPEIEGALARAFAYDKINYLMLMMVDPNVHFHVIPRYAGPRTLDGQSFVDRGWPKQPDMAGAPQLDPTMLGRIRDAVKQHWAPAAA
jgi:diadenosine tetraphosphate (Ap4A) HIT family hydrolase